MSDYNFLMETRLSSEQLHVVGHLSRLSSARGLNFYLVGGAVRDLTHGQQKIRDLDFAVEGDPRSILRRVESDGPIKPRYTEPHAGIPERLPLTLENIILDAKTNAAEVKFSNGVRAEIAMCRSEAYAKSGRAPEISPGTIFEDLKRRDFTVDAMAISLHPNSRGLLLDPTNGAADIEKQELRVIHNRSFIEDPSRIYRLLRLTNRLGFKPEEKTRSLLDSALENRAWERLDPEQQGRELRAILEEENPGRALKVLSENRLLAGLDRKLASFRVPVDNFARIRNLAQTVQGADPFLLNFYCLVSKFGSSQRARLAKKIFGNAKESNAALSFEGVAKKVAKTLGGSKCARPSQVYQLLSGQSQDLLLFLLFYFPQAKIQSRLKNFLHRYPVVRARLPRAELQALGAKPGPAFEKILDRLFFDQLDGKIKTHPQLLREFRSLAGIKESAPKPSPAPAHKPRKKSKK